MEYVREKEVPSSLAARFQVQVMWINMINLDSMGLVLEKAEIHREPVTVMICSEGFLNRSLGLMFYIFLCCKVGLFYSQLKFICFRGIGIQCIYTVGWG